MFLLSEKDKDHVYEEIIKICAKHDPENLIKMGAPEDEYFVESSFIFKKLFVIQEFKEFCQEIYDHFELMFTSTWHVDTILSKVCLNGTYKDYENMCRDIWRLKDGF